MLKYIETRFSDSQYLDLIKERLGEIQIKSGQSISSNEGSIIIINEQVNSLEGLLSLNFLKGERLYIDLWATWCIPCKIEFEHKDELHSIAEKYNIKLVYLSIDDIKLKKKWESDIAGINLKGYHLLVNKSLLKDIEKVIYKDTSISIPRYIYINENGEIINDNAPRPRAITEIEKLFRGSESN